MSDGRGPSLNGGSSGSHGLVPTDTVVLLAEDDPDMAELYCQSLGAQGFLVVIAEDGEKAVRLAEEIAPDAISLDVRMPRLDGLGALELLRKGARTRDTPVIMVTNYDDPDVMERAGTLGAVRFLVKSQITPAELADVIREILHLPERRKPGRLPVAGGKNATAEAERMIRVYRELLDTASRVLEELGPASAEQRRQLTAFSDQFRSQLAFWHAVKQRAEDPARSRRNVSRKS